MIYFTSDSHYDHKRIIQYCDRPYATIEEMNQSLIDNWNKVVKPGDLVYHLGDFAFVKTEQEFSSIIKQLTGNIHWILGNHDEKLHQKLSPETRKRFASISLLKKIKVEDHDTPTGRQTIILCHYPMLVWEGNHRGSWHIHGHCHNTLPDDPNALRLDVGVDCWNMTPASYDQIKQRMKLKTFKPLDHHKPEM